MVPGPRRDRPKLDRQSQLLGQEAAAILETRSEVSETPPPLIAQEVQALEQVPQTRHPARVKMAKYLHQSHLGMVPGPRRDRPKLDRQSRPLGQEAVAILVSLEAEVLEAEALEDVTPTHHAVEVEMVAGFRQSHLVAVRGRCQNRQTKEEGEVLRALPARLQALALVAVNLSI
jgi:hypothetical protein